MIWIIRLFLMAYAVLYFGIGAWAMIDPVNVIAPIAAPRDISIKLAILMFPGTPKLNTFGFKKAEIATNTAAKPTKL